MSVPRERLGRYFKHSMVIVLALFMALFANSLATVSVGCTLRAIFLSYSYFFSGGTLFNSIDVLSCLLIAMTLFLIPLIVLASQAVSTQLLSCFVVLGVVL